MAVITDAERKKQRNRELKREYYAKNKEKRVAQSKERYRKSQHYLQIFLLIGIRKND